MTLCAAMMLGTLSTLRAVAADPRLGIDRSNLSTKNQADRARILAGISAMGASWFRDGFTSRAPRGLDDFVDEVSQAKHLNLRFLDNVLPVGSDFDDAAPLANSGAAFQRRCGWSQGSHKLSEINLDRFTTRFRAELDAFKAANLTIDAFEIGNELDWICFNGDVPDGQEATPAVFMTIVRSYARFLRAAATLIHSAPYFPGAKIITFGLAHGSDQWDKPMHHISNPARIIAQLRDFDGVDYLDNADYHVDGYGLHLYPSPEFTARQTNDTLRADVAALGTSRPLWITEWGLNYRRYPNTAFQTRAQGIAAFHATLATFPGVSWGPDFYYAYDSGDSGLVDPGGNPMPDVKSLLR